MIEGSGRPKNIRIRIRNTAFNSVPDPGSDAFLRPGSNIRDGEKNPDPGSRMNTSDLIFESLVSVFWVKNTQML
jgi:hypothetical protein